MNNKVSIILSLLLLGISCFALEFPAPDELSEEEKQELKEMKMEIKAFARWNKDYPAPEGKK